MKVYEIDHMAEPNTIDDIAERSAQHQRESGREKAMATAW